MERVTKNIGNLNHPRQGKAVAREALSKHTRVADDSLQEFVQVGGGGSNVPKEPGQFGFVRAALVEGAEAICEVLGPIFVTGELNEPRWKGSLTISPHVIGKEGLLQHTLNANTASAHVARGVAIMGMRGEIRDAALNVMPKKRPKQVCILHGQGRPQSRTSTSETSIHCTRHVGMEVLKLLLSCLSGYSQSSLGELLDLHGGGGLLGVQRSP